MQSTFPVAPGVNQSVVVSVGTQFDDDPESDSASNNDADDLGVVPPISETIKRRQALLDGLLPSWTVEMKPRRISSSGATVQRVRYPLASRMRYEVLHPATYRFLRPLCGLDQVAQFMGVEGWREEADRIWPRCSYYFHSFVGLSDDTTEDFIRTRLSRLVYSIASQLNRECSLGLRSRTIVRGTLGRDQYEVRGVAEHVYSSGSRFILAAEVKSVQTLDKAYQWYRRSRGVQVFSTLYSHNCPTLLLTPRMFKLFVENSKRNRVYTFPSDETAAGTSAYDKFWATLRWQFTRDDLFNILVICLMRAAPESAAVATSESQCGSDQEF